MILSPGIWYLNSNLLAEYLNQLWYLLHFILLKFKQQRLWRMIARRVQSFHPPQAHWAGSEGKVDYCHCLQTSPSQLAWKKLILVKSKQIGSPRQIFKKLVNQYAIKPKIGYPLKFLRKSIDTPSPQGFLQKFELAPLDFYRVHLWWVSQVTSIFSQSCFLLVLRFLKE